MTTPRAPSEMPAALARYFAPDDSAVSGGAEMCGVHTFVRAVDCEICRPAAPDALDADTILRWVIEGEAAWDAHVKASYEPSLIGHDDYMRQWIAARLRSR